MVQQYGFLDGSQLVEQSAGGELESGLDGGAGHRVRNLQGHDVNNPATDKAYDAVKGARIHRKEANARDDEALVAANIPPDGESTITNNNDLHNQITVPVNDGPVGKSAHEHRYILKQPASSFSGRCDAGYNRSAVGHLFMPVPVLGTGIPVKV